ncbi:pantoate--beta-alanine ligase [Roseococcus sp. DSY-14]|uniref:pantoate--beta-alanine ligase n=1 Tax=Roseococcus sp. DSY-14 TaxID=3369650 RepID=UPI00387B6D3A
MTRLDVARDVPALRAAVARLGRVALVPTMGALHPGHLALVREARRRADAVVASIFVNPLQFDAGADLARYPRDEAADLAQLEAAGCALAWLPEPSAMYPPGFATAVEVPPLAARWEGEHRPGHFRGVATVCCKLFTQVAPALAVFGEKDWQQLQVVRRMARDLDLPLEVVGHPTVREADGLAMSSRNRFLSAEERASAAALPLALREAASLLADGRPAAPALAAAGARLRAAGMGTDYLALVDGATLEPLGRAQPGARLLAAARLGSVRLLDNWAV